MELDRRAAVSLALIAPLLAGTEAAAAPPMGTADTIWLWHVFADETGGSHIERLTVRRPRLDMPIVSVLANSYRPAKEDWHNAPFKTFTINLIGDLEVELSDGKRQRIGKGDLVYLDDRTGKGHVTRLLTPVANLFLRVADDFDVRAWAAAAA